MQNRHLLFIFLILVSVFLTLNSCSEEIVINPTQEEFDKDLVGCWQLVQSDELFEGDLYVTLDGNAVEYTVLGQTFQENHYDFLEVDYSLTDNKLSFDGRVYQRNNLEPMESPCEYFPDEGMVKVFRAYDAYCLCVKVGYDRVRNCFFEKRSVWSPTYGLEQDTILFYVSYQDIYFDCIIYGWRPYKRLFWEQEIFIDEIPETPPIRRRALIIDTSFTFGSLQWVDVIAYTFYDPWENPSLLQELEYWTLDAVYFGQGLGPVLYVNKEYDDSNPWEVIVNYKKIELISYCNPQMSVLADMARRDYRYVNRK